MNLMRLTMGLERVIGNLKANVLAVVKLAVADVGLNLDVRGVNQSV